MLRTREVRPPTVTALVQAVRGSAPELGFDVWLHEGVYLDVAGRLAAPHGWRPAPGGDRPALEAWPATPLWALGQADKHAVVGRPAGRWWRLRLPRRQRAWCAPFRLGPDACAAGARTPAAPHMTRAAFPAT